MKVCIKCKNNKELDEFNWKVINLKRQVYCKECSRQQVRNHYKLNRDYYLNKAKIRNKKIKIETLKYLKYYLLSHPCVDCGEKDIVVLEFDHLDKTAKDGEISLLIKNKNSLQKIIAEVKKCEVRCANCHRRKTAIESNSWRLSTHSSTG